MADELAKLRSENNKLKEKLKEAVGKNANMKDQIGKLNDKIVELNGQNGKQNGEIVELKAEIKAFNERKCVQENSTQSGSAESISTLMRNKRSNEQSNDLIVKMDAKRPKLFANCIPNWLVEVLAWIKRMEMADSFLPTSCRTFNQLCWSKLHGKNVKPHSADPFTFSNRFDKWGNIHASIRHFDFNDFYEYENSYCGYQLGFTTIPIPCVPPPAYIQSFERITFEFLNDELVEFMKKVLHLMENVTIEVDEQMDKWCANDKYVALMNRPFDVLREKMIEIQFCYPIGNFCQHFPTFFNEAVKLRCRIHNKKEIAVLVDWLAIPWRNGQAKQKFLITSYNKKFIDRIIEQFTNASQAQLYFVYLGRTSQIPYDEFILENKQTGEMLALYNKTESIVDDLINYKFLVRYPKGEEHWKRLGEKNSEYCRQYNPPNTIFLNIKKFAANKL